MLKILRLNLLQAAIARLFSFAIGPHFTKPLFNIAEVTLLPEHVHLLLLTVTHLSFRNYTFINKPKSLSRTNVLILTNRIVILYSCYILLYSILYWIFFLHEILIFFPFKSRPKNIWFLGLGPDLKPIL